MLAGHGKGRESRTAGDQVDAVEGVVLEALDVAFRHVRLMPDRRGLVLLVTPDGVADMRVPLDQRAVAHIAWRGVQALASARGYCDSSV